MSLKERLEQTILQLTAEIQEKRGAINALGSVLAAIKDNDGESAAVPDADLGGDKRPAVPPPPSEPNEAGGSRSDGGGSDRKGKSGGAKK